MFLVVVLVLVIVLVLLIFLVVVLVLVLVFAYGPKTGAAFLRFFAFKVRVLRNGLLRYIL